MWTPGALASEVRPWAGPVWRVVEGQAQISTMKLVDNLVEQALLESIIERTKPAYPPACAGLHYLLATPFRYWPYPNGSRFRRAEQEDGCFYGADGVETAIAELAFYRWLFFAEAPGVKLPRNALHHTAFTVQARTDASLDLSLPPLDHDAALWTDPTDYTPCQNLADSARAAGIAVIRYRSVRDPKQGMNLALLSPGVFTAKAPDAAQSWRLFVGPRAVQAFCDMPRIAVEFSLTGWTADPRVRAYLERMG
jgi:hypothetical protein